MTEVSYVEVTNCPICDGTGQRLRDSGKINKCGRCGGYGTHNRRKYTRNLTQEQADALMNKLRAEGRDGLRISSSAKFGL